MVTTEDYQVILHRHFEIPCLLVREKSIEIDKLLEDKQSIEEERKKADVVRQKLKSIFKQ